ncbi:MAG: phosphoribosylformylglycinamidine synthase subunit PurL, partial [Solirubrobacterales bacterium]|nr:phosphoribosylformylglycinamidine synthase subunit PurL [Solirubrobacterales bacterium]
GAEPLGLTNCLNFGNPEKPHVAWQLQRSVEGLAAACEALSIPVVGGNVSLYNETPAGPIYPTPVIGMVGELADPAAVAGICLRDGDAIAVLGPFSPSLAGSELAKQRGELGPGLAAVDIAAAEAAIATVRRLVRDGAVGAAHDISDGGLACALAEMAIAGGVGARVDLAALVARAQDAEAALFGEGVAGFVVTGNRQMLEGIAGTDLVMVGEAGGRTLELSAGDLSLSIPLAEAEDAWRSLSERVDSAS